MSVKRAAAEKVGRAPAEPVAPVAVCVIDGCDQPVLHRGLCAGHWENPQADT